MTSLEEYKSHCDRDLRHERRRVADRQEVEASQENPSGLLPGDIRSVPGANKRGPEKHVKDMERNTTRNRAESGERPGQDH
ncbi:hypothetical protein [Boudabousia marimammalium]|uniref:Uncharacterized protein n=1 Tax=Boudabousia marimammalium TaxID=156892 RepID=A0A1Q5PS81_9ACTO|nr:hypothetical protein [Boudabousia marimammalium]OKL50305.1 hypothetical protein BM477_02650 [Boudabousia marimammalium]